MGKLSVVISAYNEEKKIADCLESVRELGDEIVLVDSSSTDKTVEIAKKYTRRIYARPNNLMLNVNKNFGFSKAKGDWILSLDADERVSSELSREIKGKISNSKVVGYWIPRKNIIFGKWIQHTGWYPDHQLRLFQRDKGKFPENHVHEMVQLHGETEYLTEHIIHYNYDSVYQFLQKLGTIYAPNEAQQLMKKGYVFNWKDAFRFPLSEFINRFFAREGYKDGFHGLMLSLLMGFYHLVVFSYVWEQNNFKEAHVDLLSGIKKEAQEGYKDVLYWIFNEQVKHETNVFKKSILHMRAKLR